MRKLISILLLVIFGLPLASPLFASTPGGNSGVPVCCRKNGKHHCMTGMGQSRTSDSLVNQVRVRQNKCPYCPDFVFAAHQDPLAAGDSTGAIVLLVTSSRGIVQTQSKWRISRERSRQKRGPPAASSL